MASDQPENDGAKDEEATAFPAESGEDMTDDEFHTFLRQKVSESVTPDEGPTR